LDNNWHILSVVFNNGKLKLYIDSNLIETKNDSYYGDSREATSIYLGRIDANYTSYYLNGNMDNFRFYNRVLTQSEITEIYNAKQ